MGRVDEAVATYRALVEEDEGDDLAMQTLDRILRESDRRDDLRWLMDLRVERANTAHKLEILSDWAILEEEAFAAPDRAIALYRRVLQLVPQHGAALRALARLLRAAGDAPGGRRDPRARPRSARRRRAGNCSRDRAGDAPGVTTRSVRNVEALVAEPARPRRLASHDPRAIEVSSLLKSARHTRARRGRARRRVRRDRGVRPAGRRPRGPRGDHRVAPRPPFALRASGRRPRAEALVARGRVRRARARDPRVQRRAAALGPARVSLGADGPRARARRGHRGRCSPLRSATGLPEGAVEIDLAERARRPLFDEGLGDVDRARPYLERMLERQPGNERAFQRLRQILTTRERWTELSELYERVVTATADPVRRAELLAEVALVAEEIIGDRAKAIAYYERILELDPAHEQAVRSLDGLYAGRAAVGSRLARLLERRSDLGAPRVTSGSTSSSGSVRCSSSSSATRRRRSGTSSACCTSGRRRSKRGGWSWSVSSSSPSCARARRSGLEAVYTELDRRCSDLVRVLEIHLEVATGTDERRDLLRRVAELRDERLRDDAKPALGDLRAAAPARTLKTRALASA